MRASRTDRAAPDAFETAVRLLAQRAHSELELRRKLGRRGCPPADVDAAVARARGLGYVDEAAFARALVARRARGRGPALIAAELASKGIEREVVGEAVGSISREDMVAAARRLAARGAGPGSLLRRGFPPEVVRDALGEDP